jgi:hypothetical protein
MTAWRSSVSASCSSTPGTYAVCQRGAQQICRSRAAPICTAGRIAPASHGEQALLVTGEGSKAVPPGPPMALLVAGCVLALGVGAFMTASTQSPLFLIAAIATTIANAGIVVLGRGRLRQSRAGPRTGRTLAPAGSSPGRPAAAARWVGGANLPGTLGRVNATAPLAVLDLGPGSINLDVRPKLLGRMVGVSSVTVTRSDEVEAFPVRRRFGTRASECSGMRQLRSTSGRRDPKRCSKPLRQPTGRSVGTSVASHTDRPYERSHLADLAPRRSVSGTGQADAARSGHYVCAKAAMAMPPRARSRTVLR